MKLFRIGLRAKLVSVFLCISILPLLFTLSIAMFQGGRQAQKVLSLQELNQELARVLSVYFEGHQALRADVMTWAKEHLSDAEEAGLSDLLNQAGLREAWDGLVSVQYEQQQIIGEFETFMHKRQFIFVAFIVMISAISTVVAIVLGRVLTVPVVNLTNIARQVVLGKIARYTPLTSQDEIGQLSRTFYHMMGYLQRMADTASEIARGNIQEIPQPDSDRDVLGNAFYTMGRYLRNIADIANQIAEGNLANSIPLKSSEDMLSIALQRMTSRLAGTLRLITQKVQNIGEASQVTAQRAEDELKMVHEVLSSAEETSSSMIQMQASVEEVSGNMSMLSHSIEESILSIEEVNMSSKQIANNTTGLSKTVQETFLVVQQIGETISRLVETANQAQQFSQEASRATNAGQGAVREIVEGMEVIQDVVASAAETIKVLGNRSQAIDTITEVISDIADQTSLLALNASIIAAQAGEQGRGFAVVAGEVKDLAQRSSNAAKEIGALIRGIQAESQKAIQSMEEGRLAVGNGVTRAQRGGEALNTILDRVQRTLKFIAETTKITEEQAGLSDQVRAYMDNVLAMVREIAGATEEQQKGSAQVTESVEQMHDLAEQVKRASVEQTRGTAHVLEAMDSVTFRVQESSQSMMEIVSFTTELAKETETLDALLKQFHLGTEEKILVAENSQQLEVLA